MAVLTGLDILRTQGFASLKGRRVGLLCNQASVARDYRHTLDLMREAGVDVVSVFGPEHGLWGHAQDMVEVEESGESGQGTRFFSLYGSHREPTDEMLEGIDLFVVDLPDVGARYYTFIWSMTLCMGACFREGIEVMVLDRPNPIGGTMIEGPVMEADFASFVGLHPLPARHGMTVGEVALQMAQLVAPSQEAGERLLKVLRMEGWDRGMFYEETGQPWVMPSPNMPSVDTAVVYPGQCLLEATNLSEGRGTTRPFETFGAPFLQAEKLSDSLNGLGLPGAWFRPIRFQPTFQKHAGQVCEGCFLHVTDRMAFQPVLTSVAVLQVASRSQGFRWRDPPYEYETVRRPIDVLCGNTWLAEAIEGNDSLAEIGTRLKLGADAFERTVIYRV